MTTRATLPQPPPIEDPLILELAQALARLAARRQRAATQQREAAGG